VVCKRTGEAARSCYTNLCYLSSVFICHFNTLTSVYQAVENLDVDAMFHKCTYKCVFLLTFKALISLFFKQNSSNRTTVFQCSVYFTE
jgi:hypothetical protein